MDTYSDLVCRWGGRDSNPRPRDNENPDNRHGRRLQASGVVLSPAPGVSSHGSGHHFIPQSIPHEPIEGRPQQQGPLALAGLVRPCTTLVWAAHCRQGTTTNQVRTLRGRTAALVLACGSLIAPCASAAGAAHSPLLDTGMTRRAGAGDLVRNGGFEEPQISRPWVAYFAEGERRIPGWRVVRRSVDLVGTDWPAGEGAQSLGVNGFRPGWVSQQIPTEANTTYRISFLLWGDPNGPTTAQPSGCSLESRTRPHPDGRRARTGDVATSPSAGPLHHRRNTLGVPRAERRKRGTSHRRRTRTTGR